VARGMPVIGRADETDNAVNPPDRTEQRARQESPTGPHTVGASVLHGPPGFGRVPSRAVA